MQKEQTMQYKYRWGCFCPLMLIITAYFILLWGRGCYQRNAKCELFIEEPNIYVSLDKRSLESGTRIWLSKSDHVINSRDYIDFKYKRGSQLILYYIHPDTIYVVSDNGIKIRDIGSEIFVIKNTNHNTSTEDALLWLERSRQKVKEDSILKNKADYIIIFDEANIGLRSYGSDGKFQYKSLKSYSS